MICVINTLLGALLFVVFFMSVVWLIFAMAGHQCPTICLIIEYNGGFTMNTKFYSKEIATANILDIERKI